MQLVRIVPGEFLMGLEFSAEEAARRFGGAPDWYADEQPRHRVKLTRGFDMGVYPVTRGEFAVFVGDSGYRTEAEVDGWGEMWEGTKFSKVKDVNWRRCGFEQTDDHPAVCVTWADANAYCRWLSAAGRRSYRLPTEAEWECAYRAGTQAAYIWGNDPAEGAGWANCADLSAKGEFPEWTTFDWTDGYVFTSPVGTFRPNAWGLYDLAGNVWEWIADWHGGYAAADAVDPAGPEMGTRRLLRGGAWFGAPLSSRAAYRSKIAPAYRGSNVGFRVAADV